MRNPSIETEIKQIIKIYYLFIGAQLSAGAIFTFIVMKGTNGLGMYGYHTFLQLFIPLCIAASFFVRKAYYNKAKSQLPATLEERLALYKKTIVTCIAITNLPGAFALVALFLTGNYYYLNMFVASLFMFIPFVPSVNTFEKDFNP
ncbi:MAG: hypothetical protein NZ529_03620 [Cytophagaceae bacterium]|nr:hypothetical protein [Cytophagaceae bacterium]MDW8455859.1 hypothetical protein [Cytophagaceae bacterium]